MTTVLVLLIAVALLALVAPRYGADTRWSTAGHPTRRATPAGDAAALAAAVTGAVRSWRAHERRTPAASTDRVDWPSHRA